MKSTVIMGSRRLLEGFFLMNGMSGKSDEIIAVLADMDSLGEEAVRQKLINEVKMLPCKAETLLDFVSDKGGMENTLFALEQYRGIEQEYDAALDELEAQNTL
ncbi:MAG: hypothetical protein Q4E35_07785 [Eubacteriales bacterium]|nr:hypothetical protein [Eubacteriales bacterium]